jgi:hypothetical protein
MISLQRSIWLRAEFPVQRIRTRFFIVLGTATWREATRSGSCRANKGTDDLASDPIAYLGQVAVVGVVATVKAGQGFTIVDRREYWCCAS